jgi:hypothetical protein
MDYRCFGRTVKSIKISGKGKADYSFNPKLHIPKAAKIKSSPLIDVLFV